MHVLADLLSVCMGITYISGVDIFRICIGITCMPGPKFSGCVFHIACMSGSTFSRLVFVLHGCMSRHFHGLYRYYMHVGANVFMFG